MPGTFEQFAHNFISEMHPGGCIVAEGGLFSHSMDEDHIAGSTIVIDLAGQGQDLRVYEVLFHRDGTGFAMLAASNSHVHDDAPQFDFTYNLVGGEVTA